MQQAANILVSNIALPTTKIGSWTTRLSHFIVANPEVFDVILSPYNDGVNNRYCKKRKFITWKKRWRNLQLLNWVAVDYVKQIKKLSKKYSKVTIVVMDDPHLLEAIVVIKSKLKCEVEIVFSFHGFELKVYPEIIAAIDKILFLTQTGVEKSKLEYQNFPKTIVVGNAVNSDVFYPLENSEFIEQRRKMGFTKSDEILVWMANDRPQKGIDIFLKIAQRLLQQHNQLKIIIIGSEQSIPNKNVKTIGKMSNIEVASYLQISNYYMFTTRYKEGFGLSMIEALKCGNVVLASNRGAIPEVLKNFDFTYLIDEVEDINLWVETFNLARTNSKFGKERPKKTDTDSIWNYEDWEQKFMNAIN